MKRASEREMELAGLGEAVVWHNDMGDSLAHHEWVRRLHELRRISTEGLEAAEWAAGYVYYPPGAKKMGHELAARYHEVLEKAAAKLEEFAQIMREFDRIED